MNGTSFFVFNILRRFFVLIGADVKSKDQSFNSPINQWPYLTLGAKAGRLFIFYRITRNDKHFFKNEDDFSKNELRFV